MSVESDFNLNCIGQIAVSVNDLERATSFYRDKLGMNFLFTANEMSFFDCGGIRLMLGKLDELESAATKCVVYYKVENIQKDYRELLKRGVKFKGEPILAAKTEKFNLWLAFFHDSENNNLCLMSEELQNR